MKNCTLEISVEKMTPRTKESKGLIAAQLPSCPAAHCPAAHCPAAQLPSCPPNHAAVAVTPPEGPHSGQKIGVRGGKGGIGRCGRWRCPAAVNGHLFNDVSKMG